MTNKPRVLMPLPDRDFDPTEAGVSWAVLTDGGCDVVIAAETGIRPIADAMMLSGDGLDPWARTPILNKIKVVGLALRADKAGRKAHQRMTESDSFRRPLAFTDLAAADFDGLIVPGGHADGVRQLLESEPLAELVAEFFGEADKPVGAICHGVVLLARSNDPKTGNSVLHGRKTTALTWRQEKLAWNLTRYFARFWDPDYYRTYSEADGEETGYRSVEAEVTRALADPDDFLDAEKGSSNFWRKHLNLERDSVDDDRCAFVVVDGNYVSARWPGDAHSFAGALLKLLVAEPVQSEA